MTVGGPNGLGIVAWVRRHALGRIRPGARCVLLVGSFAEGTANESSDVDLVAVVPARRGVRLREVGFETDGRPISVTYCPDALLRRRVAALDHLYVSGGHLTDGLATRVAGAIPVHDPEGFGAELIEDARMYAPSVWALREMMRICLGFLHDAVGSRAAGDLPTAVLMARIAAGVAVDCALLRNGERNLKPKWHLRRLGPGPVLDGYLAILGLAAVDRGGTNRVIEDTEQLVCTVLGIPSLSQFADAPLFAVPG